MLRGPRRRSPFLSDLLSRPPFSSQLPESWEGDEELLFDLASVFGRLTLIVPAGCVVVNEGVLVFGSVTDQRLGVDPGKSLVVRLRGLSLFARVDVLAKA